MKSVLSLLFCSLATANIESTPSIANGNFSGDCFGTASSQIVKERLLVRFNGDQATVVADPLGLEYIHDLQGTVTQVPMGQSPMTTGFFSAWNLGAQGPIALSGYVSGAGRFVGSYTNGMPAGGRSINCNFDLSPQGL